MKSQDKLQMREKDNLLKELSHILNSSGYQVRREKLKQGHGWKAMSGSCRVHQDKVIFLDRRLPQDEQIEFLVDRITENRITVSRDKIESFPGPIADRISASL